MVGRNCLAGRPWPALAVVIVALLGTSCSREHSLADLEHFVRSAHKNTTPRVEPLPELPPVESYLYTAGTLVDPFAPENVYGKVEEVEDEEVAEVVPDPLEPDSTRPREKLESFPLDSLRLVGTIVREGEVSALVTAPDNQIHQVIEGNYLGQNNGKVVAVDLAAGALDLEEVVKGPTGQWEIRPYRMSTGQ